MKCLTDDVCEVPKRLLDGVFGHVPRELGEVGRELSPVGSQVLVDLLPLVLHDVTEVVRHLAGDLLNVGVNLGWNGKQ